MTLWHAKISFFFTSSYFSNMGWNFQNYFRTLAKIEIRIWNIALIWLQKIEVRKYFNFMICRKLKSELKIIFWSDLDEIIFWKNIMISKYFSGRSQKYFWKYVFKIPKSYFFSKLFSDFDEVIFWNHIIFSKYFFIRSQKYFTEVIIFCAPLILMPILKEYFWFMPNLSCIYVACLFECLKTLIYDYSDLWLVLKYFGWNDFWKVLLNVPFDI